MKQHFLARGDRDNFYIEKDALRVAADTLNPDEKTTYYRIHVDGDNVALVEVKEKEGKRQKAPVREIATVEDSDGRLVAEVEVDKE